MTKNIADKAPAVGASKYLPVVDRAPGIAAAHAYLDKHEIRAKQSKLGRLISLCGFGLGFEISILIGMIAAFWLGLVK